MFKKIVPIIAMITFVGCNTTKSGIVTSKKSNTKPSTTKTSPSLGKTGMNADVINAYIAKYKDIAIYNMQHFGIPASITLAQGILESGAGQSKLALTANNHFGIKCYKDWKGDTTFHDDDASQECFRKYNNPEESFQDHSDILSKRTRYASLFNLSKTDYKGWAKGLKAAGYATDPRYPEKLITYIEQYQLDDFDQVVGNRKNLSTHKRLQEQTSQQKSAMQYEVQQGDTLYSISKKFSVSIEELKKQNSISDNSISIGQTLLIK